MIYFDNGAATKPSKEVIEFMHYAMNEEYFNPSSLHGGGLKMEIKLKTAANDILSLLDVQNLGDFYFTSGGTESNNLAILSTIKNRKQIITTKAEHPSILNVIEAQKSRGYKIDYLKTDKFGLICVESLKNLLSNDTCLVSIMDTNNELGTIQNTKLIGETIKANSNALFHIDAVASFGKIQINTDYIDLISVSSHKIHGPQGVGGLFVRKGVNLAPLFYGGSQQNKVRPGTQFTVGNLAFALAVKQAYKNMDRNLAHVKSLYNRLINFPLEGVHINSPEGGNPYILNMSILNTKGQVIVNALSQENIYISTGAACNSKNFNLLKSLGSPKDIYEGALRFSFSHYNTMEEIDKTISVLTKIINNIRLL